MRKNRIVSAILALLMTLSSVAALVLPAAADGEIYLQNSYHKLVVDKKLTVAYFGGSVTVGTGLSTAAEQNTLSWRGLTRDWLKTNFPDATITEINAAIGGTGSRFASYRSTRDLKLDTNTIDLIFIENCINDNYEGLGGQKAELKTNDAVNVAKILANNPYADIVFLGTTEDGKTNGADYGALVAHREFAEENGFLFLNIGKYLWDTLNERYKNSGGAAGHWSEYFLDIVHPLAPGYRIYADNIIDTLFKPMLGEGLDASKYVKTAEKLNLTDAVTNADTDRFVTSGIGVIKNVQYAGTKGFTVASKLVGTEDGAAVAFKFTGTNAYLWSDKKAANGKFEAYIDGSETPNVIDMYRSQEGGQQFLFPVSSTPLANGEHTVVLVLKAQTNGSKENYISNIAIDGADINSVEFIPVPDGYGIEAELKPVTIVPNDLKLKIDGSPAVDLATGTYDGKEVLIFKSTNESSRPALDGWKISSYNLVANDYPYAAMTMYVDDPNEKLAGVKPQMMFYQLYPTYAAYANRNSDPSTRFTSKIFTGEIEYTPNAWQSIVFDTSELKEKVGDFVPYLQYHYYPYGNTAVASNFSDVTLYMTGFTFYPKDQKPESWVDLDTRITGIFVDGEALEGFKKDTFTYDVELPFGTTATPVVTATSNADESDVVIEQATSTNGTATVTLKGETANDDVVYTLNFSVSDKAVFTGFTVNGDEYSAFDPEVTEYTISLPNGTTEVPTIEAIYTGNPAKIEVSQAQSLDGQAVIVANGVTYTLSFMALPSYEDLYPDQDIIYCSQTGAGDKSGVDTDNAIDTIDKAVAKAKASGNDTVIVLIGEVKATNSGQRVAVADVPSLTILGAPGAKFVMPYGYENSSFSGVMKGTITFDDIEILCNGKSAAGELVFSFMGNDVVFGDGVTTKLGTYSANSDGSNGGERTGYPMINAVGDGSSSSREQTVTVNGGHWKVVRAGGWGGHTVNSDLHYVFGGTAEIDTVYAGGHAEKPTLGDSDAEEAKKTIFGDVTVLIQDDALIKTFMATNKGIIDGDLIIDIEGGTVNNLNLNGNVNAANIGSVRGNSTVTITGGTVAKITGTERGGQKRSVITYLDTVKAAPEVSGVTYDITVSGNGTAEVVYGDEGDTLNLTSDCAFATVNGTMYSIATGETVTLSSALGVALTEGKTTVLFSNGKKAIFYADNEKFFESEGLPGVPVIAPTEGPKKTHYAFKGWSTDGQNVLADLGTYGDEDVTFTAVFEEEPKVNVTVFDANGGSTTTEVYKNDEFELPNITGVEGNRKFLGYAQTQDATEAEVKGGDKVVIAGNVTYYPVFREYSAEDARYIFKGQYCYGNQSYLAKMYFVGPKANITAFGLTFNPDFFGEYVVNYGDDIESTGTNKIEEDGSYFDVVTSESSSAIDGTVDGGAEIARFRLAMTAEQYVAFAADPSAAFSALELDEDITAAYDGDYLYCMDNPSSLNVKDDIHVVVFDFDDFEDDKTIEVSWDDTDTTVEGENSWTMLTAYSFTAVPKDGDEAPDVSYTVDGVACGVLLPTQGNTYVIPAEKVLGNIELVFDYGEIIPSVAAPDAEVPAAQETPDNDLAKTPVGANYTVLSAVWSDPEDAEWDPAADDFGFDTSYTLTVTVKANEGYAINTAGKTEFGTIDGVEPDVSKNPDGTVSMVYVFENTVKELGWLEITVPLIRAESDAAYKNFGKITVYDAQGEPVATVIESDEAGSTFTSGKIELLAGTYTVVIEKNGYLTETVEAEIVYNETLTYETATLTAGDVATNLTDAFGDGKIDLEDFAWIRGAFAESSDENMEARRELVDIDEDGVVTVFDLNWVRVNYNNTNG